VVAAGVATLAVLVVMVGAADVGVIIQSACQQGRNSLVCIAADAAVDLDAGLA
jgi:hypothetical protein